MVWDPNLWTIPLLLAGVLTATLAVFGWIHRAFPRLRHLSVFLVFLTIWILAYLGEILATSTSGMVWFARMEYVGIVMVGPGWLAFALAYTGRSALLKQHRAALMLAIPTITLLLAWTTPLHGALW